MYDVRSRLAYITTHFPHDADVIVTVEKRILVISCHAAATCRGLEGLEGGIAQHHHQPLGVLVVGSDGDVLFRDELW